MTTAKHYPQADFDGSVPTRTALHAYARILGDWLKACRPRRKHWWHASLRPSLNGLTTGVVHAGIGFEVELDLKNSRISGQTSEATRLDEPLDGQSALEFSRLLADFLTANGVDSSLVPSTEDYGDARFDDYSVAHARVLGEVLSSVSGSMAEFRAAIREETSPIQLWPHHFDLSVLWLPGEKIDGEDPENEEYSDKQMNFGFTFGDEAIAEPYFYITAYPMADGMMSIHLPPGTRWHTDSFTGALLTYQSLLESDDPHGYLLELWTGLLAAGRTYMLASG